MMKRKNMYQVATWLMAAVATVACTGDEWFERPAARTWSATGTVGVNDAGELTRALSVGGDDGSTLFFNWTGGEALKVYDGTTQVGTMTATVHESNTAVADIDGDITGSYSAGDKLTYYYPDVAMDFTGQKGTIADLSKKFHFMQSEVEVKGTDSETGKLTMGYASLKYRMAVIRLRLTDAEGKRLHVEELEIQAESGKLVEKVDAAGYVTYTSSLNIVREEEDGEYTGDIYVALLNESTSADTYTLTAKVGENKYASTAESEKITAKFEADNFYTGVRSLTKTVDGDKETSGDFDFTFSSIDARTYTGSAIEPTVTVSYEGTVLTAGTDYELHYLGNTNAGKAFIVAMGKGTDYENKAGVTTFTINPKALTDAMASSIAAQTYTGSAIEPTVTVTDSDRGATLVEGTDYTVTYEDNTDVGTATATITGTGNYTGTLTRTFAITAVAGTLTLDKTSVELYEEGTATVSVTAHSGDLSLSGFDSSIATAELSGETLTITGVAKGTTTVTVTSAATANYAEATETISVTVKKAMDMGNAPEVCELVDLGLGVLWANMNVGSTTVTGNGNLYAWGETTAKGSFSWSNYKYGSSNKYTKYCNDASQGKDGFTDDLTVLESCDDAATSQWGGNWRMPTVTEIQELIDNTEHEWQTNYNGATGMLLTSKVSGYTDKSIFLPAAGYKVTNGYTSNDRSHCDYWSASLAPEAYIYGIECTASSCDLISQFLRAMGFSVRAVQDK